MLWVGAQCMEYFMQFEFGKERRPIRRQQIAVTPAELTIYAIAERPQRASHLQSASIIVQISSTLVFPKDEKVGRVHVLKKFLNLAKEFASLFYGRESQCKVFSKETS